MKIYLAGAQTGGNIPVAERRIILQGGGIASYTLNDEGLFGRGRPVYDPIIREHRPFILESFYYADADTERLLPYFGDFMLDSGAFTFMQGKGGKIEWDDYIERYADFINRNKIEKFFELDIDSVVGYEKVKEYRKKLESLTSKQCIPVWHKNRGAKEYENHCKQYSYVGIGGYVVKELKPEHFKAFPTMIEIAHKNNAKVHCLGFTNLEALKRYHFDSVDSTAWTTGNRFGYLYFFDGKTMIKRDPPNGHKIGDSRGAALHNYAEWIKFQKYAITNL